MEALGMPMVGISPQSVSSHERFADQHGLTVPLLSDPGKKVARKYGVLGPGGFIRRAIFLVDPAGTVRYRNVALFGLRYQDVGDLERAISEVQPEAGLA
jgi:peroxiredoxin Q/BCP